MHPELQRLEQQYFNLAEELQRGNVSEGDALAVIASLTAIDGEGMVWSIDPYSGEFVRAFPGQQPVAADPSRFIPAALPPVQYDVPPHGTPPGQFNPYMPQQLQPLPPEPTSRRASRAGGKALAGSVRGIGAVFSSLRDLTRSALAGHGRTVLVVVLGLVLAAAIFLGAPKEKSTDTPAGAGSSTVPVSVPDITLPGETAKAPLPEGKEVKSLLASLSSATPEELAALLPQDGPRRWTISPLLGASRAGFDVLAGDPVSSSGGVLLPVRVTEGETVLAEFDIVLTGSAPWQVVELRPRP